MIETNFALKTQYSYNGIGGLFLPVSFGSSFALGFGSLYPHLLITLQIIINNIYDMREKKTETGYTVIFVLRFYCVSILTLSQRRLDGRKICGPC